MPKLNNDLTVLLLFTLHKCSELLTACDKLLDSVYWHRKACNRGYYQTPIEINISCAKCLHHKSIFKLQLFCSANTCAIRLPPTYWLVFGDYFVSLLLTRIISNNLIPFKQKIECWNRKEFRFLASAPEVNWSENKISHKR